LALVGEREIFGEEGLFDVKERQFSYICES
jgi:hypothetical protein